MARKIKLTIGVPASGKSTWAKQFTIDNPNWVRISRDDFRLMLQQSQYMPGAGEKLITKLVEQAIAEATAAKFNVIVDQTNVNLKYLRPMVNYCRQYGDVDFELFPVTKDEAIARDAAREASVGAEIIERMFNNYIHLMSSEYSDRFDYTLDQTPIIYQPKLQDTWKPKAYIVDLDGTLFHSQGKRGHYEWSKCHRDALDLEVSDVIDALSKETAIIFVTSRDEEARDNTIKALQAHGIAFTDLYMRAKGDMRKDTVVKREIYDTLVAPNFNVVGVFEDRDRCVDMWRSLGLKCYQTQRGTF